jgi:nucleotide sugar dehydrogenase
MLNIKAEEIDNAEKRGKYTISILNCEQIGLLHACLFAEAGFKVICVDTNQAVVSYLTRGKAPFLKHSIEPVLKKHVKSGCFKATNDTKAAVAQSDIILVTTPAKLDEKDKIDYSAIESACKWVGSSLRHGALVIIVSVIGVGTTEGLVRETLENASGFKVGVDFGLAYSPVQLLEECTLEKLSDYKRIVAAADKKSLDSASAILGTIARKGVVKTNDVKTAEALTLFEGMHNFTNLALVNEFALFCEKADIDYCKMQKLAKSTFALPTLTFEKNRIEPYVLLDEAESLNAKLRFPKVTMEINKEILKHAFSLIQDALRSCGKTLRKAKISLIGISRTPNMMDTPKSSVKNLAKMLETKGAKISLYDPYLLSNELADLEYAFKKSLTEAVEGADCIAILTGHDQFKRLNLKKLKIIMRMPAAIVDFDGVIEPEKVEMEGFIYRGLGRGVWTK